MQLPTYDPAALAGILATHTCALLLPPRDMGSLAPEEHRHAHLCPSTRERLCRAVVA
ncbi:hypothetical protein FIBSPDRAFT_849107 [Athelia psychrophila]|uniref:Uncharacterized protein n=1 Tax=Athelia psychrophila TaxID=1759441 RepID=A0A166UWZ6_9AGAM|nr:hypothetical protein FIBSPDRAFT_849107 [Fibularhizoctonia sp. CBS 109695]